MHTKFSGSNGQNAHRWLRTLRYENPEIATISPSDWLGIIDGLLEGDAATWADHHPRVKHILRAGSLKEATRADVETFKKALIARFPPVKVEITHSQPGPTISSPILKQDPYEDLDCYYQRALISLYQRNGVDLDEAPLTEQEHDALKKTIRSYLAGLVDDDIRREGEQVWVNSQPSLSLHQIHKLSKDKALRKWHGEGEKPVEILSDLGNIGPFYDARANCNYYFPDKQEKHVAGAADMRSSFPYSMKDHSDFGNEVPTTGASAARNLFNDPESAKERPSSKYGPLPELRRWTPGKPITSDWDPVRNPPPENGFTSRIGNSHHTPNTSNGSNPPTTLPNANMFGGGTGNPSRPQSSLFGESPPYSIFDDRHPANVNWTAHPAYGTNNKRFGDGSFPGANHGSTPPNYSGMPPPGLSRFEPRDKKPTGGLFGDGPAPTRRAKGTSPNRHSRGPSDLKVETHLRPSSLSEDTVRQFYSPGRNIFGQFSTKSPSDVPDAPGPSNTAANTSAQTSHQGRHIKIQPPSLFHAPGVNRNSDAATQASQDRLLRKLGKLHQAPVPDMSNNPGIERPVPENRLPHESYEDYFMRCFGSNRQRDPAVPGMSNTPDMGSSIPEDYHSFINPSRASMDRFMRLLSTDPHLASHFNFHAPSLFKTLGIKPPVSEDSHARDANNNPFKDSMDKLMRELNLDTPPVDADIGPPDENNDKDQPPFPSPIPKTPKTAVFSPINDPTTSTAPSPQPSVTYSQVVNTQPQRPFQPTVESDPESETPPSTESEPNYEIPITIKQSQGQKKKRRGQGGRSCNEKMKERF